MLTRTLAVMTILLLLLPANILANPNSTSPLFKGAPTPIATPVTNYKIQNRKPVANPQGYNHKTKITPLTLLTPAPFILAAAAKK